MYGRTDYTTFFVYFQIWNQAKIGLFHGLQPLWIYYLSCHRGIVLVYFALISAFLPLVSPSQWAKLGVLFQILLDECWRLLYRLPHWYGRHICVVSYTTWQQGLYFVIVRSTHISQARSPNIKPHSQIPKTKLFAWLISECLSQVRIAGSSSQPASTL